MHRVSSALCVRPCVCPRCSSSWDLHEPNVVQLRWGVFLAAAGPASGMFPAASSMVVHPSLDSKAADCLGEASVQSRHFLRTDRALFPRRVCPRLEVAPPSSAANGSWSVLEAESSTSQVHDAPAK